MGDNLVLIPEKPSIEHKHSSQKKYETVNKKTKLAQIKRFWLL